MIVASNGMLTGGRVVGHLRNLIDDPTATILFVGYQGEGTLGAHLQAGAKEVKLDGQVRRVRCQVRSISGFSAHADESELLDWLGHFAAGQATPAMPATLAASSWSTATRRPRSRSSRRSVRSASRPTSRTGTNGSRSTRPTMTPVDLVLAAAGATAFAVRRAVRGSRRAMWVVIVPARPSSTPARWGPPEGTLTATIAAPTRGALMRPSLNILDEELTGRIVDEAMRILAEVGMEIRGQAMRRRLLDHGLSLDHGGERVLFPRDVVERGDRVRPELVRPLRPRRQRRTPTSAATGSTSSPARPASRSSTTGPARPASPTRPTSSSTSASPTGSRTSRTSRPRSRRTTTSRPRSRTRGGST